MRSAARLEASAAQAQWLAEWAAAAADASAAEVAAKGVEALLEEWGPQIKCLRMWQHE